MYSTTALTETNFGLSMENSDADLCHFGPNPDPDPRIRTSSRVADPDPDCIRSQSGQWIRIRIPVVKMLLPVLRIRIGDPVPF